MDSDDAATGAMDFAAASRMSPACLATSGVPRPRGSHKGVPPTLCVWRTARSPRAPITDDHCAFGVPPLPDLPSSRGKGEVIRRFGGRLGRYAFQTWGRSSVSLVVDCQMRMRAAMSRMRSRCAGSL